MSTLTSGGSGSSASIGYMGALNVDTMIGESLVMGFQILYITGQTSLGGKTKYLGSTQFLVTIGKAF